MPQPTTDAAKNSSGTDDNPRDRSNAWMQGYTDGQKEKWDVQLLAARARLLARVLRTGWFSAAEDWTADP
jgi:hypothetical protein